MLLGHSSQQRGKALDGYLWLRLSSELSVGGNGRRGGSGYVAAFLTMLTIDVNDGINGGGRCAAALLTMSTINVNDGVDGGGGRVAAL